MDGNVEKCTKCGETRHIDEFVKNRRVCKSCENRRLREYYKKNRKTIIEKNKARYRRNIDKAREYQHEYYAKNRRRKIKSIWEKREERKFNGLLLGCSNISQHPKKSISHEYNIIRKELRRIFKKYDGTALTFFYPSPAFATPPIKRKCWLCGSDDVVFPQKPKSYDYNYDGFIMPYCTSCGTVND